MLRDAGFDAAALKEIGFSAGELKDLGYHLIDLKNAGYSLRSLSTLYEYDELVHVGFDATVVDAFDGRSVPELKNDGFSAPALRDMGFFVKDLFLTFKVKEIMEAGFTLKEIEDGGIPKFVVQALDGRPTSELRRGDYTAKMLVRIGFELKELVAGGYDATGLREAGIMPADLKEHGFSAGQLKIAGFSSRQLYEVGFTLQELMIAGYSWKDLVIFLRVTHQELTQAGYRGIDPKHRLFMQYRPDVLDEEQGNPCTSPLFSHPTLQLPASWMEEGMVISPRRPMSPGRRGHSLEPAPRRENWGPNSKPKEEPPPRWSGDYVSPSRAAMSEAISLLPPSKELPPVKPQPSSLPMRTLIKAPTRQPPYLALPPGLPVMEVARPLVIREGPDMGSNEVHSRLHTGDVVTVVDSCELEDGTRRALVVRHDAHGQASSPPLGWTSWETKQGVAGLVPRGTLPPKTVVEDARARARAAAARTTSRVASMLVAAANAHTYYTGPPRRECERSPMDSLPRSV